MKYKLIACDLDGTLLQDDSKVSRENLDAIGKITQKGIIFALVTGRTLYEIPEELLKCSDIRYIVFSDGSVACDRKNDTELYSKYIDRKTALKLFNLLKPLSVMTEIYQDGHPVTEKRNLNNDSYEYYKIDEDYRSVIDQTRIGVDNLESYIEGCEKIELFNIFFREQAQCSEYAKLLENIDEIQFTTSMENNIEITSKSVLKGVALERLCDYLRISSDSVICVGDSPNDFSMFDFSGLALSAGNACEEVKKRTDKTVCTNNEHIVKYILENILEV